MYRRLFSVPFALVALLTLIAVTGSPGDAAAASAVSGDARYIVQLEPGISPEQVAGSHGLARAFTYERAISGFAGPVPQGRLKALMDDPRVVGVFQDRSVEAIGDPGPLGQGNGNGKGKPSTSPSPDGQVVPENIKRIGAGPGDTAYSGLGVAVAIMDTGVDMEHADLNVATICFDAFGGNCDDGNGHGTHVAGIVAAQDNSVDTVGASPGATVVAVKVLNDSGSGSDSTILAGIEWILANRDCCGTVGIRVVNASLGRDGTVDDNPALRDAVAELASVGIIFIAAAGNDPNKDTSNHIPSAYPSVIAVASTTAVDGQNQCKRYNGYIPVDTASYFTTDGGKVLISAPGEERENITKGCSIQSVGVLSLKAGGGTTRMSGTSMAAPAVAGVAALLVEKNPALTAADYTAALSNSDRAGVAPLDSLSGSYTLDGEREGVASAPHALAATP